MVDEYINNEEEPWFNDTTVSVDHENLDVDVEEAEEAFQELYEFRDPDSHYDQGRTELTHESEQYWVVVEEDETRLTYTGDLSEEQKEDIEYAVGQTLENGRMGTDIDEALEIE